MLLRSIAAGTEYTNSKIMMGVGVYLKDSLFNEDAQEKGMETVHQVGPTPIFGREEIFAFFHHEPLRE